MRKITRTISKTVVSYVSGVVGKQLDFTDIQEIELPGAITKQAKLMVAMRKKLGKDANFVITSTRVVEEKRAISYDDFMAYSLPVEDDEDDNDMFDDSERVEEEDNE